MVYNVKTEGMGCPHCIKRVTGAMEKLGANIARMELNDFTVDYDGSAESIRAAVEALGFKVKSVEEA